MNYTDLNATHPCKWCGCQCSIFNTDRQCEQCWQARKLPIAVLQKMIDAARDEERAQAIREASPS